MGKSSSRFIIQATGKGGETYYTSCQCKNELKKWMADHQDKLLLNEVRVTDNRKNPLLKLFSF
ncbi:hypothetical protein [Peribacillus kribbensis]|uniref:hypothetical protein n=1 Tax=Peribacillus kribbensis TaxID=356658 RepID=UPI000427855F|nr:hypothetical protein [Peribacillus kribbensis]